MFEARRDGKVGRLGEFLAEKFLRKKGYEILEKNFRCPLGEIDLVAKEGGAMVFVEVKGRTGTPFGFPEEQISWKKRKKLLHLAEFYLKRQRHEETARIDIVTILFDGNRKVLEIDVVQNAVGGLG